MGCCSSTSAKLCLSKSNRPTIRLMTLGLDGAGKTSFVRYLLKDSSNDLVPTIGFASVDLKNYGHFSVQIYDTGGGKNIRDIWINYFPFVHGLIFLIDSADSTRLDQVKEALESVLTNKRVQGKPLLVLINKQDVHGAMDEVEITRAINLNSLVNKYQCPTKVESCSLLNKWGNKVRENPLLDRGYNWLLNYVKLNWPILSKRVDFETAEQIKLEQEVMRKRIEKFRNKSKQNGRSIEREDGVVTVEPTILIDDDVPVVRNDSEDNENNLMDANDGDEDEDDNYDYEYVEEIETIETDDQGNRKIIVRRRISTSEPKERTILIFGSLDTLDRIPEESNDGRNCDEDDSNQRFNGQLSLPPRPKSTSIVERRRRRSSTNHLINFNRNKIAPI